MPHNKLTIQDILVIKMMENGGTIDSLTLRSRTGLKTMQLTNAKDSLVRRGLVDSQMIKQKKFQPFVGWKIVARQEPGIKKRIKKILEKKNGI